MSLVWYVPVERMPGYTLTALTDWNLFVIANSLYLKERADQVQKDNPDAITAPGVFDDIDAEYSVLSLWHDTVADRVYTCTDNTAGAAVWVVIAIGNLEDFPLLAGRSGDTLVLADDANATPLVMTPRSTPPATPALNGIYLDDGNNTLSTFPGLRYWDGAAWVDIVG